MSGKIELLYKKLPGKNVVQFVQLYSSNFSVRPETGLRYSAGD